MCDGYRRGWTTRSPHSPVAAWIALAGGMLVGALCMRSPLYDGPIATALGGTDLNWVLGFLVAGGLYQILSVAPPLRPKLTAVASET